MGRVWVVWDRGVRERRLNEWINYLVQRLRMT